MSKEKSTRPVGRPPAEGKKRQFFVTDDVHQWISSHGGSHYLNETIRLIMQEKNHQYLTTDAVHQWIINHGGSRYLNDIIEAIMSVMDKADKET